MIYVYFEFPYLLKVRERFLVCLTFYTLILYKNIQIEDCSCATPDHARHEPTPSQTKLHVAQRVRPARKNIILAKKTSKNVDF